MNPQRYPKYLGSNLKVFGLDIFSLSIALFIAILIKRAWLITPLFVIATVLSLYILIELYKSIIPKDYIYKKIHSKKEINNE